MFNLWVMDANGEGRRRLDNTVKAIDNPLWSPDGNEIFFVDNLGAIYKYNLIENELEKILEGGV